VASVTRLADQNGNGEAGNGTAANGEATGNSAAAGDGGGTVND